MAWIGLTLTSLVAIFAFELIASARETLSEAERGIPEGDRKGASIDVAVPVVMTGILLGLALAMQQAFACPMSWFFAGFAVLFLYAVVRIVYFAVRIRKIDNQVGQPPSENGG